MNSFDEGTWSTGNGESMSTTPFTGTPFLISCHAASALDSSIDTLKDVAVVVVMRCQRYDLDPTLLLDISCPPVRSPHNLLM